MCLAAVRVDVFVSGGEGVRGGGVIKTNTFTGTVFGHFLVSGQRPFGLIFNGYDAKTLLWEGEAVV